MIQAFLDESGIHDSSKVCVIAGYYGHPGAWRKLDERWRRILRRANIPLDKFHALDLIEHRKFFFAIPRTEHAKLTTELAQAVALFRVYPVTLAVIVADFLALTDSQKQFFTGATSTTAPSRENSRRTVAQRLHISCHSCIACERYSTTRQIKRSIFISASPARFRGMQQKCSR